MSDFNQTPATPDGAPAAAESTGSFRNASESFGTVPHDSESFRSVPNSSASFRNVPKTAERSTSHSLTVREVAKMFEAAGVSRTERSIVNWCLPNKHGVARLDAAFDANERKWFISQESVVRAVAEEQARASRHDEPLPNPSEDAVPNGSEHRKQRSRDNMEQTPNRVSELEREVMNLQILEAGKDFWIKQLLEEKNGFLNQLVEGSRRIGELESELRQLTTGRGNSDRHLASGNENSADTGDMAAAV